MNESVTIIQQLSQLYAYTSLQMHEAIAARGGLSGTDQKYLVFFITRGTMTAGELAGLTGLTTGAVTGLIDRFEKKKLVARESHANDRRKTMIVPDTDKIMALLKPMYQTFSKRSAGLIASFSDEDRKILATYFEKAIALMSETSKGLLDKANKKSTSQSPK